MKYIEDSQAFLGLMRQMLLGCRVTLPLFFYTLLLSLPLGLLLSLARMSPRRALSVPARVYILVLRGTPLLLQIFAVYFILPRVVGGAVNRTLAAVTAFALNYAAYFAEIFRGGIASVPVGQREAGKALGFTRAQIFARILLPQVVKRCLLPVSNEVVTLVKDTSLVTAIALADLYYYAKKATSASGSLLPIFFAGAFYLVMNAAVEAFFNRVGKKLDYYRG